MIRINKTTRILIGAFSIRVIVLMIIFFITPNWSMGFLSNSIINDDVRLQSAAQMFGEIARYPFDQSAFNTAFATFGEYTGQINNIFAATAFWGWICCWIYYFTRSIFLIRLFNICCASASIYYFMMLTNIYLGKRSSEIAGKLLAYLPYPVIFSCFAYKDSLIMLLTIKLMYNATLNSQQSNIPVRNIIEDILISLCLMLLRSGLSAILIGIYLILSICRDEKLKRASVVRWVFIVFGTALGVYVYYISYDYIVFKAAYYLRGRSEVTTGLMSLVTVNSVKEIYKLPFAIAFATIAPIGVNGSMDTWFDVVGILNICMAPIAVGAVIDVLIRKERCLFWYSMLGYYLITIIASIGIFRHYYSLLFIPIMMYTHFLLNKNSSTKIIWEFASAVLFVAYLAYLFL